MTAAGVCDECGSGIDTKLEAGSFGMYRGETISCPNCTHQTPAERVVEAAQSWAGAKDDFDAFDGDRRGIGVHVYNSGQKLRRAVADYEGRPQTEDMQDDDSY